MEKDEAEEEDAMPHEKHGLVFCGMQERFWSAQKAFPTVAHSLPEHSRKGVELEEGLRITMTEED